MKLRTTMLAGAVILMAATAAEAQVIYGGMGAGWRTGYLPSYDDWATTPGQGLSYGLARVIQAEARYNADTAEAAINFSEAQRRQIENWQKWTETYFEVRRINREMRAAERGKPPTEADFIRYAQIGKPRRLTPSELDSITGDISWPLLLRAAELAKFRATLDRVFAQRAASGVIDGDAYLAVYQLTGAMRDELRQRIHEVPASDYVVARRFLDSLAYEARLPAT
ncbi:MAG: hypothetical protein ACLQLG_09815 [Thermoguttaceae bacterium]